MPTRKTILVSVITVTFLALFGCRSIMPPESDLVVLPHAGPQIVDKIQVRDAQVAEPLPGELGDDAAPEIQSTRVESWPGTGQFINRSAARRDNALKSDEGDIELNFDNTNLVEFVDTILGKILNVNYMIDPKVSGNVYLTTSRPIARTAVLPTLETVLRLNQAILSIEDGLYLVLPQSQASLRSLKPVTSAGTSGYQVIVVPLRFVSVGQIEPVLKTMLPDGAILMADEARQFIMLAGTAPELRHAQETIAIFDIDQMQGRSISLFSLQQATAESVKTELDAIIGADKEQGDALRSMVRIVPIERINALLVISSQPKYLERIGDWITRLDHNQNTNGLSMYVYPVQNSRAEHLAQLLSSMFGASTGDNRGGSGGNSPSSPSPRQAASPDSSRAGNNAQRDLRIIADEQNNSLVIMADRADYQQVMTALRKLDVLPLQVLVEATIVEVSLTDELSYGLQWFFKNGAGSKNGLGELFPLTVDPSFSYSVAGNSGDVRAVLSLLAADSRLNVISSPSLMVRDNYTATIKVGDQVPVRTSETTSLATSGSDALITSTIQYRDTGVLLEVTPRVNLGGMVALEITQDVNDVDQTTTSEIDSPTIIQRRITTNVAVQSGETVVLGGLIRENNSQSKAGVPGLRNIPFVGKLFGSTVTNTNRTELLVLITPTAIETLDQARTATEEMKTKMSNIRFDTTH